MEPLVTPNFTDLDTGDPHLLGLEDHPRTIGYVVKNHGDPYRKLSFPGFGTPSIMAPL